MKIKIVINNGEKMARENEKMINRNEMINKTGNAMHKNEKMNM